MLSQLEEDQQAVKHDLDTALQECTTWVVDICSKLIDKKLYMNPGRRDQLKLLNLLTWAERYSLSLEEILRVLLKVWRGKFSNRGLGVSISTLTGVRSKQIILDYSARMYPGKENVAKRKADMQSSFLSQDTVMEYDDPVQFVNEYRARINRLKKADEVIARKFQRRRWRTSPWV